MRARSGWRTIVSAVLVAACQATPPSLAPSASATAAPPAEPTATSAAATATPLPPIAEHWIGIRTVDGRGEFFDRRSNERWVPRGANYARLERNAAGAIVDRLFAGYDPVAVQADLEAMRKLGYSAVRIALENCREDCIGDPSGGLRPDYLANLADFLRRAQTTDLPVFLQSNDLPEQGGFVPQVEATCCGTFDGYLNSQYFSPVALNVYRDYWVAALQGLREAGAPLEAIFAYDVRNEVFVTMDTPPLSLTTGTVTTANGMTYDLADVAARAKLVEDGIVHWVDEMAAAVRSVDPGALVAVGEFAPNAPNVWRGEDPRAPPTIATFQKTSVDFIDVHPYPGYIPLSGLLENMGVTGDETIPIVIGEYGAFTLAYPDPASGAAGVMRWQADSCAFGIDGWFHWHWRGTGDHEVWTGTEGEGAINTVLSPRERRDPCATQSFSFLRENLALDGVARASRSLADRGPELAIDGDPGTGWVAGDGPPQWIEIDLGGPAEIDEIRLSVDQSPAGPTAHRILGGPSTTKLSVLGTLEGSTAGGQTLTWLPDGPLAGVRVVRIETTASPSWVAWFEIEVLGRRD